MKIYNLGGNKGLYLQPVELGVFVLQIEGHSYYFRAKRDLQVWRKSNIGYSEWSSNYLVLIKLIDWFGYLYICAQYWGTKIGREVFLIVFSNW